MPVEQFGGGSGQFTCNFAYYGMIMNNRPNAVCGAKIRQGGRCLDVPAEGKKRCRLHGGAEGSGAPKGGRNGRYKHGWYSTAKIAERRAECLASLQGVGIASLPNGFDGIAAAIRAGRVIP